MCETIVSRVPSTNYGFTLPIITICFTLPLQLSSQTQITRIQYSTQFISKRDTKDSKDTKDTKDTVTETKITIGNEHKLTINTCKEGTEKDKTEKDDETYKTNVTIKTKTILRLRQRKWKLELTN